MRMTPITLLLALVLLTGCIDSDDDDNVSWNGVFVSDGVDTSAGGAVIAGSTLTLPGFVLEDPVPFGPPASPPDQAARSEARRLAPEEAVVLDAIFTQEGMAALVEEAEGVFLVLFDPEPVATAAVPPTAERLLFAGEDPLRLLVLLVDGRAVMASRER